jgi:hypothetical protein
LAIIIINGPPAPNRQPPAHERIIMNLRQWPNCLRSILPALVAVLSLWASARAQQTPALAQPNPEAPTLNMPVPLGVQRGTALDLTLTGNNLAEPTGLWTSFPASVTIPNDNNNGKDNAKLRLHLDVPKDAPLGFHSIRLATTHGMSNFRLFCIDDLPQIMELDSNRSKSTPQEVSYPCVVVGKAEAESSDYYKISVKAGQRISFEILGRRLGSAFDPQLTLYDGRSGQELPGGHSNDAPGLQADPRLTYVFKQAGEYLIEVRDALYRGGADFWYRLRIGDFPCATVPIPMAGRRGGQVIVHFTGPMVEGVGPVEIAIPADPTLTSIPVAPRGANGLHGWPVILAISDHEERVEQEPNNEPARANRIPVPGGITGQFLQSGDLDHFVFTANKGQRYAIEAQTHELHSPTEVYIVLKDAKGTQLAASNPTAGPRLDFTAPADGDFTLAVEHLLYWYGPSEAYRITVNPYEPGFELSLGIDRFDISPGGTIPISILATRRDYTGPIDVSVIGYPAITGHVTINAGQPAAANQPAATLFLSASANAAPGPCNLRIQGSAAIGGKTVIRDANLRAVVNQNLSGLSYPPHLVLSQIGVAVTEKPPFTLSARVDQPEASRGSPVPVTITVSRTAGFTEEIALSAVNLPANVTAALKNIPKSENEIKAQLTPAANAPLGQFTISVTGKAKFKDKQIAVTARPFELALALPFELQVEPAVLQLTPGGKAKAKVTALRRAGYQGPIEVELRNLPANVTAPKATINMGQTVVEIEITAAADAAVADKADVQVQGTADSAGKQSVASPNLTIRVGKK